MPDDVKHLHLCNYKGNSFGTSVPCATLKDPTMKLALATSALVLALAQSAMAQDGAYFGLGLAVTDNATDSSVVPGFEASSNDVGLALTAGYRFASTGALAYGVEGNLDLMSGNEMSDGGTDACTGSSPTWCEVDAILRLRGTLTTDLSGGGRLTGSLGAVLARGLVESGPGNNVNATGNGLSLGVAWENLGGGLPVRVDVNYDAIRDDNVTEYERSMDMLGIRVSYMF